MMQALKSQWLASKDETRLTMQGRNQACTFSQHQALAI